MLPIVEALHNVASLKRLGLSKYSNYPTEMCDELASTKQSNQC